MNFSIERGGPNQLQLGVLKGDTGEKGDKGDTGEKGDKGDTGDIPIPSGPLFTQVVTFDSFPVHSYNQTMYITGSQETQFVDQTGNITTPFSVCHNFIMFVVKSLTGEGTITVLGNSVNDDSTSQPNDTEVLSIQPSIQLFQQLPEQSSNYQYYKTYKRWNEVSSITLNGMTNIVYDVYNLNYTTNNQTDFTVSGYRIEALSNDSASKTDLGLKMFKIRDDGNHKMSFVTIEDIGININNSNSVQDHLRNTRNFTPTTPLFIWPNNTTFVLEQYDFDTYFTNDENRILGSQGDGIIIFFLGTTLGSNSGPVHIRTQISFYP